MTSALRKPATLTEFLAWEEKQPLRYEFDGVRAIAMTGGTVAHARIQRNLAVAISRRLRYSRCEFFGSDLKIEAAGKIRYPDGFVVCSEASLRSTVIRDPVVIFEVLSDSTTRTDLFIKNQDYAATPSVRRYVILSQDEIGGSMYERVGMDWVWHAISAESTLPMPEIGIEVPVAEFYEGVTFASETDQVGQQE
jgi:Uma2 family endonuclease